MSATLRALAIVGGVLLIGFGLFPLFVFAFGAAVDPLRAFLVWLGVVLLTVAVLVVGITLAVRRRRRGGDPLPFDAATFGAIVLLGVLAVFVVFPLAER